MYALETECLLNVVPARAGEAEAARAAAVREAETAKEIAAQKDAELTRAAEQRVKDESARAEVRACAGVLVTLFVCRCACDSVRVPVCCCLCTGMGACIFAQHVIRIAGYESPSVQCCDVS